MASTSERTVWNFPMLGLINLHYLSNSNCCILNFPPIWNSYNNGTLYSHRPVIARNNFIEKQQPLPFTDIIKRVLSPSPERFSFVACITEIQWNCPDPHEIIQYADGKYSTKVKKR